MARLLPGRARAMRTQKRTPRWTVNVPAGHKFRAAQPERWKWAGENGNNARGSFSRLSVEGTISGSTRRVNNLPWVSAEELERWWYIENGILPPDDETDTPLTDEEMADEAREELDPIEANAHNRAEEIIDEAKIEIRAYRNQADILEADDDPETRQNSLRKARRLKAKAEDTKEEAQIDLKLLADTVRQEREQVKIDLKAKQQKQIDDAADRVDELRANLMNEIQTAANRYFANCEFELDQYDLH